MSHRCINAFQYGSLCYPGGFLVEDGDPILASHSAHFAKVDEPLAAVETASAAPSTPRIIEEPKPKPRGRPRKTPLVVPENPAPTEAPTPEGDENA